jgi:hypothetical protein
MRTASFYFRESPVSTLARCFARWLQVNSRAAAIGYANRPPEKKRGTAAA